MTKYYLYIPIYSLLLVSVFITSCNGQEKTNTHKGKNYFQTKSNGNKKL